MIDGLNAVVAIAGLLIALFALWQSHRSNRNADESNRISRDANALAQKALRLQEDESAVRLVVRPRMMNIIGEGEDSRVRPVVTVINLSAFPLTIEKIWWKTAETSGRGYFWKNPTITAPYHSLPARLGSRESLTAIGNPDSFGTAEDFLAITAAVACTECGESVEGMTPQWQEYKEKVRAKGALHWDNEGSAIKT